MGARFCFDRCGLAWMERLRVDASIPRRHRVSLCTTAHLSECPKRHAEWLEGETLPPRPGCCGQWTLRAEGETAVYGPTGSNHAAAPLVISGRLKCVLPSSKRPV